MRSQSSPEVPELGASVEPADEEAVEPAGALDDVEDPGPGGAVVVEADASLTDEAVVDFESSSPPHDTTTIAATATMAMVRALERFI